MKRSEKDIETQPILTDAPRDKEPLTKRFLSPSKAGITVSFATLAAVGLLFVKHWDGQIAERLSELQQEQKQQAIEDIQRDTRISKVEIDSNYQRQSLDRIESMVRDLNIKVDELRRVK